MDLGLGRVIVESVLREGVRHPGATPWEERRRRISPDVPLAGVTRKAKKIIVRKKAVHGAMSTWAYTMADASKPVARGCSLLCTCGNLQ